MNKARPFQLLRKSSFRQGFSSLMSAAFLLSILVYCMCGPFCGRAAAEHESAGCCSSHAPVQAASSGCCGDEPGETRCSDDLAEDALQLSDSSIPIAAPSAVILAIILPETAGFSAQYERAVSAAPVPIAPAYIEFQSFLI